MVGVVMDGRRPPGSGSFGIKRTLPDFILDIGMIYCHAMIEKEVLSTSALKNYFL